MKGDGKPLVSHQIYYIVDEILPQRLMQLERDKHELCEILSWGKIIKLFVIYKVKPSISVHITFIVKSKGGIMISGQKK